MVLQPLEDVKEPTGNYAIRTEVGWAVCCSRLPEREYKHLRSFFVEPSGDTQPMCFLCTDIMDSQINIKEELSVQQQTFMTAVTKSTRS